MQHPSPSAPPKSSPIGFDHDRLFAVIEPIVRSSGAELVDIELKNENGWVLRVYVEKLGANAEKMTTKQAAIDLELCSNIARELSPALDVADPIPHRYALEVGSPGVERTLKRESDYLRFAGEKAKLKLQRGVEGQKVIVGVIGDVADKCVSIVEGGKSHAVPLNDIVAAHLVFEFGPSEKPSGPKKKKK